MRVLCCALATHGFVNPAIAIALALRELGHSVAFVTGPSFTPTLKSVGFERIPRAEADGPSFQVTLWGEPISIAIQVKHIEHALERFVPDLLLASELAMGPLIAGELHGLPVAMLGLAAFPWSAKLLPPRNQEECEMERRHDYFFTGRLDILNGARKLFGLPPCPADPWESRLLGDLFLLRSVPDLEGEEPLPSSVHFIGNCSWEPDCTDPELEDWLAETAADPLIYVQQGRHFQFPPFWPPFVAAGRGARWRVAAALGRMQWEIDVGPLPESWLVRAHIPQARVLRHARAVVSSGNTTSVLGAVEVGLPLLLVPAGGEQIDLARRCRTAGAALTVDPHKADPESLRQALDSVLESDELLASAARLRDAFARFDGPRRAAELIEGLAPGAPAL